MGLFFFRHDAPWLLEWRVELLVIMGKWMPEVGTGENLAELADLIVHMVWVSMMFEGRQAVRALPLVFPNALVRDVAEACVAKRIASAPRFQTVGLEGPRLQISSPDALRIS